MKKAVLLLILAFLLSGCATYKFQHGKSPYDKGYVATRDGYTILEYTSGEDNSVPEDLGVAKQRFKRRRHTVESYYKKMGYVESRFKEGFWDPPVYFCKFVTGVFRIPAIAISDFRYRHSQKYRQKVIKRQEQEDLREETVNKKLREGLAAYIQEDLKKEAAAPQKSITPQMSVTAPAATPVVVQPEPPVQPAPAVSQAVAREETGGAISQEAVNVPKKALRKARPPKVRPQKARPSPKEKSEVLGEPAAVITAKPMRGYSPLKVHFSGSRSYSPRSRITSYTWDFGDGDTASGKNSVNTFWSTTSEPRTFAVTLTITDAKGNSATAEKTIEVINK